MNERINLEQSQNIKQTQRLILSHEMQQALHLLQLPVLELSQIIHEELERNPLLEIEEEEMKNDRELMNEKWIQNHDEDLRNFLEGTIAYESSLHEYLMQQAQEEFTDEKEKEIAEVIIGNLDEQGFFSTPIEEIALLHGVAREEILPILKKIQTFDPTGIAAFNLQESFLIQLTAKGKEGSLAYKIIQNHFSSMLHNKIPLIARSLKTTPAKIRLAIENEISSLNLHPGKSKPFSKKQMQIQMIVPDLLICEKEEGFSIEVNEAEIPSLRFNRFYLRLLNESSTRETKEYIQEKIASGKWLLRNIHERHHTLYRIAEQILDKQKDFFSHSDGKLLPMTMKSISEELGLHESTIARACANKYLSCSRGIFRLRYFFSHAYVTETGEVLSSKTVKQLLVEILEKEDKHSPFSDEILSTIIKKKGIPCARRTVAKYRQELGIGSATQRRVFC